MAGPLNVMDLPPKNPSLNNSMPSATVTTSKAKKLASTKTKPAKPSTGAGLAGALAQKSLV